jgi:hypothetical protein
LSDHEPIEEEYVDEPYDPEEELPRRERRRLLNPLTVALFGLLLGGVGFLVGVEVEKGQSSGTAAGGQAAARRALGAGGGAAALFGGATFGQVSTVDGQTLYVTDAQGNTIKVTTSPGSQVTRAITSSVRQVRPGDVVVVSGSKTSDGSIQAQSIRVNRTTDTGGSTGGGGGGGSGGGGLGVLFGGGGRGG